MAALGGKLPVYEESVFINCPFDPKYNPIFRAIVFTIRACDFTPRCALEFEGHPNRLQKILDVIKNCKYGVHDVSIPDGRLNMPLELGLFMGACEYGKRPQNGGRYLILEGVPFSSKKYLSDLAGIDPMSHNNSVEKAIECLRDWLIANSADPARIPSAQYIKLKYKSFKKDLPAVCASNRWDHKKLLFPEFLSVAESWLTIYF